MRVQILPLTPVTISDTTSIPFALVIDECSEEQIGDLSTVQAGAEAIGATGVLVFAERIDVVRDVVAELTKAGVQSADIDDALPGVLNLAAGGA